MTLNLHKEFRSFSSLIKNDLTLVKDDLGAMKEDIATTRNDIAMIKENMAAVKEATEVIKYNITLLKRKLCSVRNEVKQDIFTSNRSIAFTLYEYKSQLDTIEQAVGNDLGERMCNQTADLVVQLDEKQNALATQLVARQEDIATKLMDCLDCFEPNKSNVTESGYSCGGTSGWRRVVFLNMSRTGPVDHCPTGWQLSGHDKRACGRVSASERTCDSAVFPTGDLPYSQVCGRVLGYQFGALSAFFRSSQNIESVYVNGLSLTHGKVLARQHVWTFAGGVAENSTTFRAEWCPCDHGTSPVPTFVGSNYYCESGNNGPWVNGQFVFYPDDQLWDGKDCIPRSSCCKNTKPYFVTELGCTTSDDLEARLCSVYERRLSDVAVEVFELYVK